MESLTGFVAKESATMVHTHPYWLAFILAVEWLLGRSRLIRSNSIIDLVLTVLTSIVIGAMIWWAELRSKGK